MKKIMILFVLALAFGACKVNDPGAGGDSDGSTDTRPTWKVTVNLNGGTGLDRLEYDVKNGETLPALSNTPKPPIFAMIIGGFKTVDGQPFTLGVSPVNNNVTIVIQWKDNTANLDCSTKPNAVNDFLTEAIAGDSLGVACAIQKGVDFKKVGAENNTALMLAIINERYETTQYLLTQGAKTTDVNIDGSTPLILAAAKNLDLVKLLLANGSKITEKNNNGTTALLQAAYLAKYTIVKYLLENAGASITEVNNENYDALMQSCLSNKEDISGDRLNTVKYLATYPGVDRNRKAGGQFYNFRAADLAGYYAQNGDPMFTTMWNYLKSLP